MFLHEIPDIEELFLVISQEMSINPSIVEKDYWVMHALWGLQQQVFNFELKGGTSLSKGYNIINRFSEDIDIQIHPAPDIYLMRHCSYIERCNNKFRASNPWIASSLHFSQWRYLCFLNDREYKQ